LVKRRSMMRIIARRINAATIARSTRSRGRGADCGRGPRSTNWIAKLKGELEKLGPLSTWKCAGATGVENRGRLDRAESNHRLRLAFRGLSPAKACLGYEPSSRCRCHAALPLPWRLDAYNYVQRGSPMQDEVISLCLQWCE
jgi:hypothetical protein